MNEQQRNIWIGQLKMGRRNRPCNAIAERAGCDRVWFLRKELRSKFEALASIRSYLSSLPEMDHRRSNAYLSQEKYRGEALSIRDELTAREEVLYDSCRCKCGPPY